MSVPWHPADGPALFAPTDEVVVWFFFFFQAEDGIRDYKVTGVQTCALPICRARRSARRSRGRGGIAAADSRRSDDAGRERLRTSGVPWGFSPDLFCFWSCSEIGRASCRERV